jgi:hypothetical protein
VSVPEDPRVPEHGDGPADDPAAPLGTPAPAPLLELLPEGVADEELERLARADSILRVTPAPPAEVPEALRARLAAIPERIAAPRRSARARRGRRALATRWAPYAAAAAACAAAFAIGFVVRGGGPEAVEPVDTLTLNATPRGPGNASMAIEVLPVDGAGNWALLADVAGLPQLEQGQYYELWLTQNRRVAVSCGRFLVDADGRAIDVWLNAPYRFRDYDDWVVTREGPGKDDRSPWLLRGPVTTPV